MKILILTLVSIASFAWAQDLPTLERGDDNAPNNKIGLGKNEEGQPNLPVSYFGAHVNKDKSGPQDACPNCGEANSLAAEPIAVEFNGDSAGSAAITEPGTKGFGGEQK